MYVRFLLKFLYALLLGATLAIVLLDAYASGRVVLSLCGVFAGAAVVALVAEDGPVSRPNFSRVAMTSRTPR